MSLETNLSDFATRAATQDKVLKTLINGNAADLSALDTTAVDNLVNAINEVYAMAEAAAGGALDLDGLTDVVISSVATGNILRYNGSSFVNVLGTDYYQPLDSDLTSISALTTTSYGRAFLELANQGALMALLSAASETVSGVAELATQAETNTGTDDARIVTPLKFQTRMAAYAQPLDSDLTAIAALTTTSYGRAFLTLADQAALVALLPSYQPLDSDLTSIAALSTTSYGRALLELANQAGLMALLSAASETAQGIVELATTTEVTTGTDTVRAATAAGVKAHVDARILSATDLGAGSPSSTSAPSQSAVKAYADALIGANDAMVFKGVIDASANPNYPAANRGDTYKISVAGKIGGASGPNVEVGDIIICITDSTSAGNHATVGAAWDIIQVNLDGAVIGPASVTDGHFAQFDGTTGKLIKGGLALDTDGTLAANSATRVPSQSAVKSYAQPLDSDLTSIAALSTTSYGRGLLETANQAALTAALANGTESLAGILELATQGETNTGTDDVRAVTPLKLQTRMAAYAQPLDATLTAIAAGTTAANKIFYWSGVDTLAVADFSSYGRTLVATADAAAARTSLDVWSKTEIGDPERDLVADFEAGLV